MNCDASSTQGLTRFRGGLILAFALALGVALTSFKHTALAALDGAQAAQGQRAVTLDAQTRGAFVVAKKDDKGWGGYDNNWNGNWNNRAHVREWNRKPYYGEFIGGVILGSIFAANGIGVVPYAPEPNLCWYWADPYMYRGYWDYCY